MKEFIYRILQKRKERTEFYPGTRQLEKREYLTKSGIKSYKNLSLRDKLQLNIKIQPPLHERPHETPFKAETNKGVGVLGHRKGYPLLYKK